MLNSIPWTQALSREKPSLAVARDVLGFTPLHFAAILNSRHIERILVTISPGAVGLDDVFVKQSPGSKLEIDSSGHTYESKLIDGGVSGFSRMFRVEEGPEKVSLYDGNGLCTVSREEFEHAVAERHARPIRLSRTYIVSPQYVRYVLRTDLSTEASPDLPVEAQMALRAVAIDRNRNEDVALAWIPEINGYGVFAARTFRQYEYVCSYIGRLLIGYQTLPQQPRAPYENEVKRSSNRYLIDLGQGGGGLEYRTVAEFLERPPEPAPLVDASYVCSFGAFVNDSRFSNANPFYFCHEGLIMCVFYATRDIDLGEQVTIPYAGKDRKLANQWQSDMGYIELMGHESFPSRIPPSAFKST